MNEQTQHPDHHGVVVPTGVLIAAGLLLSFTIVMVLGFRLSGQEPTAQIPQYEQSLISRALRFEDGPNGSVQVFEVHADQDESLVHIVQSGQGGFIRGVLRSMARSRNAHGIAPEHPFVLNLEPSGTLVLEDPQTGQRIDLKAFGPDNIDSFRAMLASEEA